MQHGHDANREIAGNAAADLEHAQVTLLGGAGVEIRQPRHVFNARADGMNILDVAADHGRRIHVAQRRVFPARHHDGQVFLRRREHPRILGINLVIFLVLAAEQHLIEKFVGEIMFAFFVGRCPDFEHGFFHSAHGFAFGNAGVGHAVHVAFQQALLVFGGQGAVVRHAFVIVMGDQVENVFFQIRTGAGDQMHLVLADHFGQGQAEFGRAHGAAEGDHHATALVQVRHVTLRRVHERGGIEMPVMMLDELGNRSAR